MNRPVNIFVLAFRGEKKETVFETLEELVMEKAKIGHNWKNPVWRNADGTVAEW